MERSSRTPPPPPRSGSSPIPPTRITCTRWRLGDVAVDARKISHVVAIDGSSVQETEARSLSCPRADSVAFVLRMIRGERLVRQLFRGQRVSLLALGCACVTASSGYFFFHLEDEGRGEGPRTRYTRRPTRGVPRYQQVVHALWLADLRVVRPGRATIALI